MSDYLWENDDITIPIIEKLQRGLELESREYLKPIFKWTKALGIFLLSSLFNPYCNNYYFYLNR
jgi:hypothetical protein